MASTQWKVPLASAGLSWSPRPVPMAVPPRRANGTSAPSFAPRVMQLVAAELGAPERVAGEQGGCGIRRPAAHAAGDGHVLLDLEAHSAAESGLAGEQPGRLDGEVAAVGREPGRVDAAA